MKQISLLLLLVTCFSAAAQKAPALDKRLAGIDAQLENVLADWKAAGFAVAVVEKGQIIYAKGFGYRDYEKKLPVTPNTLFAIGSVTKSFTSSLIGLLQKEKKVELDKPALQYLPNLHFYNTTMNNNVTLRHMMSHQTGLPRHDYSWYFFATPSRDSVLQRLQYQEPTAGIRERWQYNNFMFAAQGAITEKLWGQTWEESIEKKLFAPLGMKRSTVTIKDLQKDADAAIGYGLKRDSLITRLPYYAIEAMAPAGSINSSVTEMAAWLITWMNGGKYKGNEVLPAAYVTEAITPQAIVGAGLPTKERPDVHFVTYGFGWAMASYRGHYRVDHGGNIDGFSANAAFYPTDSIGIVVLTNQDGSTIPGIVRNILSDRLLNLKAYDWNGDIKKNVEKARVQQRESARTKTASPVGDTRPTHALPEYTGRYHHPGYGSLQLFLKKDSLFATLGNHQMWLRHNNYNVFNGFILNAEGEIDTITNGNPLQFQLDLTGNIESLTMMLESGLQPLVFKKQLQEVTVPIADLKKYEGHYLLPGMEVLVSVKGGKLHALVPGQPEYELLSQGNHKFALKTLQGFYAQFEMEGDAATAMTFMQPNGNFRAPKKK